MKPDGSSRLRQWKCLAPFSDVIRVLHDQFEFVGLSKTFVDRHGIPFRAQGNPVHFPSDGIGSAGLEVDGKVSISQLERKVMQVVNGWFTSGNDDNFASRRKCFLRKFVRSQALDFLRKVVGMPSSCRVAPRTMNGATVQADEECGFPHVAAFSLPRVEALVNGQVLHPVVPGWYVAEFLESSSK